MKKIILFALAVAALQCTNAQSIFGGIPKPVATKQAKQESTLMLYRMNYTVADSATVSTDTTKAASDSIVVYSATPENVFRIVTNVGTYGFTGNGYRVMAGVGIGYQHYKFNTATQEWDNVWGVSLLEYAGGNISPTTPTQVAATGVNFSFGAYTIGLAKDGPVWQFTRANPVYLTVGANFPLFANKN